MITCWSDEYQTITNLKFMYHVTRWLNAHRPANCARECICLLYISETAQMLCPAIKILLRTNSGMDNDLRISTPKSHHICSSRCLVQYAVLSSLACRWVRPPSHWRWTVHEPFRLLIWYLHRVKQVRSAVLPIECLPTSIIIAASRETHTHPRYHRRYCRKMSPAVGASVNPPSIGC